MNHKFEHITNAFTPIKNNIIREGWIKNIKKRWNIRSLVTDHDWFDFFFFGKFLPFTNVHTIDHHHWILPTFPIFDQFLWRFTARTAARLLLLIELFSSHFYYNFFNTSFSPHLFVSFWLTLLSILTGDGMACTRVHVK